MTSLLPVPFLVQTARFEGETVRQRPEQIEPEYLGIPREFYRLHHVVTLTADVIFVNGLAFFTVLGRDIRFGIV